MCCESWPRRNDSNAQLLLYSNESARQEYEHIGVWLPLYNDMQTALPKVTRDLLFATFSGHYSLPISHGLLELLDSAVLLKMLCSSVLPSEFSSKPLDCLFPVSHWRVFLLLPLKCWCSQCPVLPLHSSPPLSLGDVFQDPQWMPEIADSTEPYTSIYYIFSYTYQPVIKLIYRLVTV